MSEHTTDEIKCPYCGFEFSDSWEYNDSINEQILECYAEGCGKNFKLSIDYTVHYYTTEMK